ncbi:MAG: CDP-alcohol phosphatidyltransferase family protein [Kangiellaceae bacterium]|jgi:cardiolipin synthase|nr:CDP-alcohol phosphatidyltransferase family protein [Kangiellaceae bacterium]
MFKQIPNIITVIRILLIAPLLYLLHLQDYSTAIWIFFVAGASDGIDGFLAKRFDWKTRFGAILDPIADKLLLVSTLLMLSINSAISWWLFALITARDIMIVIGAYVYHRAMGPYEMQPSRISKANTFFQITMVVALLISLGLIPIMPVIIESLKIIVIVTTVLSGLHYAVLWGGRYRRNKK